MSNFTESDHLRGGDGTFKNMAKSESPVALDPRPTPAVIGTPPGVIKQHTLVAGVVSQTGDGGGFNRNTTFTGDEEFNAAVRQHMVAFDDEAQVRIVEEYWQSSDGWSTESGQEVIAYCEGTYSVFRSFDVLMTALDNDLREDKIEVAIKVADTPATAAVYKDTEPVFGTITDVINRGHSPGFTFTDHATGATASVEFSQVRAIMQTEAE